MNSPWVKVFDPVGQKIFSDPRAEARPIPNPHNRQHSDDLQTLRKHRKQHQSNAPLALAKPIPLRASAALEANNHPAPLKGATSPLANLGDPHRRGPSPFKPVVKASSQRRDSCGSTSSSPPPLVPLSKTASPVARPTRPPPASSAEKGASSSRLIAPKECLYSMTEDEVVIRKVRNPVQMPHPEQQQQQQTLKRAHPESSQAAMRQYSPGLLSLAGVNNTELTKTTPSSSEDSPQRKSSRLQGLLERPPVLHDKLPVLKMRPLSSLIDLTQKDDEEVVVTGERKAPVPPLRRSPCKVYMQANLRDTPFTINEKYRLSMRDAQFDPIAILLLRDYHTPNWKPRPGQAHFSAKELNSILCSLEAKLKEFALKTSAFALLGVNDQTELLSHNTPLCVQLLMAHFFFGNEGSSAFNYLLGGIEMSSLCSLDEKQRMRKVVFVDFAAQTGFLGRNYKTEMAYYDCLAAMMNEKCLQLPIPLMMYALLLRPQPSIHFLDIDRLEKEAVVFLQANSPTHATVPSMRDILSMTDKLRKMVQLFMKVFDQ